MRDFIYIDDVVDALVAAAADRSKERIFNIGSGTGHSLLEVVTTIERLLDRKVEIELKPSRPLDLAISILSIERAMDVLGWAPMTSFEAGLRRTIDWWRARG